MNRKVLITGATGFIGANIVRDLIKDKSFEIHIIKREKSNTWRIADLIKNLLVHNVDITDLKSLTKIVHSIKPEIILHLANVGVYGGYEGDPEVLVKVNLLGTINLIKATEKISYKVFVNTGSSSEYGDKESTIPMREDDVCRPQGVYAISKLASTLYAADYAKKNNKPIINLRIFTPYGPYDNEQRLVPYVVKSQRRNKKVYLNKKNTVRDFVYISDVVDAYKKCIDAKNLNGQIFNIGSGNELSVNDIVKVIEKNGNKKLSISWGNPSNRYESTHWSADIRKAKNC